jgi:hypothetical protein
MGESHGCCRICKSCSLVIDGFQGSMHRTLLLLPLSASMLLL